MNAERNETPIYSDAFSVNLSSIWSETKFALEIEDMAYAKACNSFMLSTRTAEIDRRELFYSMFAPFFATDKPSDSLNERFGSLPSDNTYFQRAIRTLCTVYNASPQRTFEGISSKQNEIMQSILNEAGADSILQKCYRLAKVSNEVLVRPKIVNQKIELQFLTQEQYRYILHRDGTIKELWIPFTRTYDDGNQETLFHYWDEEKYQVIDKKGLQKGFQYEKLVNGKIVIEELFIAENFYKKVPFVRLNLTSTDAEVSNRYAASMWELVKASLMANLIEFCFTENLVYSSYSIMTMINWDIPDNAISLGAGRVLRKDNVKMSEDNPIPPEANYISPATNYVELEQLKADYMKRALKNLGLPNSFVEDTSSPQSGVAMKIERQELEEQRLEDITQLKRFEKSLMQMIALVGNNDPASKYRGQLQTEFELSIDYADFEVYSEPKEELELSEMKLKRGLLSLKDYVKRLSGADNIGTNEEAVNYLNENLKYIKLVEIQDDNNDKTSQPASDANDTSTNGSTGTQPEQSDGDTTETQ